MGIIQHNVLTEMQNFSFFGLIWHTLTICKFVVILWYDMAYLSNYIQNCNFCGIVWHTIVIMAQDLCTVVLFAYFRLSG